MENNLLQFETIRPPDRELHTSDFSYVTKKKCKAMNKVDRKETEKSISFTTNMWHDGEYRTQENYRL